MKRELIAQVAHEVNRAYCASLGDTSQPAWEDAPEWQKASALVGVDMHLANPDATPEQSHESWLAQKAADGWTFGEVKDAEAKTHPCFKPYAELPAEQKAKDYLFRGVVHALKAIPDVAQAPVIQVQDPGAKIPVKYVGKREVYRDGTYGTGLVFTQGETKLVPVEKAKHLLQHPDVYVPGEMDEVVVASAASEQVQAATDDSQAETEHMDMRDSLVRMDKEALVEFAKTHFNMKLDKRTGLEKLRTEVITRFDQFGVN